MGNKTKNTKEIEASDPSATASIKCSIKPWSDKNKT
jgi:hypothetical protein